MHVYKHISISTSLISIQFSSLLSQILSSEAKFVIMCPAEYQPLLLGLDSHVSIPDLSSEMIEEFLEHRPVAMRWWPRLFGWESRLLWLLSGSSIVYSVFSYMLSFVTLMFSGHLGALELAGASIASVGIQGLAYGIMVCVF